MRAGDRGLLSERVRSRTSTTGRGLTLSIARVRGLLRLLGEVSETLESGTDPAHEIAAGLTRLVDADVGGVVFGPTTADTNYVRLVSVGFSEPEARQAERLYVSEGGHGIDPVAAKISLSLEAGPFAVGRRRDLVDDESWYRSEFVNTYRRAWRLDDSIYGASRAGDGHMIGFGCFRAWGGRPFTEEDRALTQLFWEETAAAIADRYDSSLSRRQRETLRLLLAGDSSKTIAAKLGLSVYTVNDYIKAVYRAKRVRSRGELMARGSAGRRIRPA